MDGHILSPPRSAGWLRFPGPSPAPHKDKAQTGVIALVLDAAEAASSAFETHLPGVAEADTIESMVGAARQGLGEYRLNVFSDPAHAQAFDRLMQGGFGEAMSCAQGGERRRSHSLVGARNGAG
ncbi:hypothetical protein KSX_04470 [Ktedonospora formicarum]|uniref:Uncharacterized protein n=1 Tax=Ktedonospora formicarum TaxID=2778364 RepID=A0A8J3HRH9_9CHLR|nr:hypothetical protein KSX_04470 [Ktedonospora formicarum]